MEKNKNNKSFGILFFIVFLLVAFWPIINSEPIRIWSLIISLIFLVLGILNSKILTPFKITWIKFGEFLGKIIAPLVMGLIYFVIITPIGILMRLLGKDLLDTKYNKKKSYWIKRSKEIETMKKQF